MWGNHLLDIYQHTNFNISFPHDLTRNPTRLIQWQYWWWFWFSSVFVLYYFLITKVFLKRSLKFRPKIVTSYRSHGRWGDIIVAVIPIFWCLNILSHSTLLLRMSEFQTETNILTIRVRGRQWYWVYKLEIANFFLLSNKKILLNNGKNISVTNKFKGGNTFVFETHESYRQYWRNWFQNKTIFFYNTNLIKGEILSSENNLNDFNVNLKNKELLLKNTRIKNFWYKRILDSNIYKINNNFSNLKFNFLLKDLIVKKNSTIIINNNNINNNLNKINDEFYLNLFSKNIYNQNNNYLNFNNNLLNYYYYNNNNSVFKILLEIFKINNNYIFKNINLKNIINNNNFSFNKEPIKYTYDLKNKFGYLINKLDLIPVCDLNLKLINKMPLLFLQKELEFETKNLETTFKYFIVFDQHRRLLNRFFKLNKIYFVSKINKINNLNNPEIDIIKNDFIFKNEKKSLLPIKVIDKDGKDKTMQGVNPLYTNLNIKSNNSIINTNSFLNSEKKENFDFFSPSKYNIKDDFSIMQGNIKNKKKLIFNQRLLHTTSVLVLPTSLNITVITNSYDVIHSWFIPGLGLKMDCVPGRSTHHTLYIDHPGIYYGQCAEICGRFHHHMPIKIAALQWEHFLLWWYHYTMNLGINPLLKDFNKSSLKEFKNNKIYPTTSKFISNRPII